MIVNLENENAIEKMAKLITEGKVNEFVNLFPTLRLKRVATSMFIHVTKSGILKRHVPMIVFKDDEYLMVANHIGFDSFKSPLIAIWVLGNEDGMLWIHRLLQTHHFIVENNGHFDSIPMSMHWDPSDPKNPLLIDIPNGITKASVKQMMGFDYDYKVHPYFELDKNVRIQGDLYAVKIGELTDKILQARLESEIDHAQYIIKSDYKRTVESIIESRILDQMPDLREELIDRGRINSVRTSNRRGPRNGEEMLYLHNKFPPKNFYKYNGTITLENLVSKKIMETDAYNDPEFVNELNRQLINEEGRIRSERATKLSEENYKQITERIVNHVIVIEKALEHGIMGYHGIEIPEKTTAFLIHDEHGTTKIELLPGIYEFRLLNRHELG